MSPTMPHDCVVGMDHIKRGGHCGAQVAGERAVACGTGQRHEAEEWLGRRLVWTPTHRFQHLPADRFQHHPLRMQRRVVAARLAKLLI